MLRLSTCIGLFVILSSPLFGLWYLYSAFICVIIYLLTGGLYWVKMAWKTLPRDFYGAKCLIKVEYKICTMVRRNVTIADVFLENVKLYPNKMAFISVDNNRSLTFTEANNLSNKIANYFYKCGYRKGDVVSLLMENRIEYIPIWLGLSKIGIITSLLNTNLKKDGLEHCLKVSESKALIYTDMFLEIVQNANTENIKLFEFSNKSSNLEDSINLRERIDLESICEPTKQGVSLLDRFMYIYTSGTTGFPKAAIIRGVRFAYMGYGNAIALRLSSDDIGYCPLPLYHTTGGVGLAGGCLFTGSTLVLRKRFSASNFFDECCRYNCTVFNYIGEVCTYLHAQPKRSSDILHQIRSISGAGLRPSVWKDFQERFQIPHICEMYGATEGNATVINLSGRVGAVGFKSILFPFLLPVKLVKVDSKTGEILRDSNGIAIEVSVGEPGEMVGKIKTDVTRQFDGYVSEEATQKTIVHNVFKQGDTGFRTGDILVNDEEGYFYFHDRTGDTFRWKGENVSTNEVEGVMSKTLDMVEVCVYGVKVPNNGGRAGMACIADPDRKVCVKDLHSKLSQHLPSYAVPVFIRLSKELSTTGSFKYKKVNLQKDGYDICKCKNDKIFVYNKSVKAYVTLDDTISSDILAGRFLF